MKSIRVFFRAVTLTLCFGAMLALAGQAQAADPDPAVKLETSLGDIVVRLDARKAPISTANFVQYVKSGFYDGTVFHRVIKNFMSDLVGTSPAAVAFWFPALLASFVAVIAFAWVWALGSIEAGVAAGILTSIAPGFLARTLLGFYDTDLVTLFFPLLMTLAPASWAMRYMLLPGMVLRRLSMTSGVVSLRRLFSRNQPEGHWTPRLKQADHMGNPLRWQWVVLLGCSGVISWWTQEWHSVFPYLIRYNVALLAFMSLVMAPRGRRALLLLGSMGC